MSVTNIIIMLLSIFSIILLSSLFFIPSDSEIYRLIEYFDFILCLIFLYDFASQFINAKNKWIYFYTVGWLDLLSSIPLVSEFRFIRAFRVFRIFRIIKSFKLLFEFVLKNKSASLYGFVVFSAFTILVLSTTAVLYVEKDVGNIKTAEDALWWSFVTITTVGYGDFYPVTNIGKFITFILIVCGIASFGTAISYINEKASSFKN
ncbi:potassium channel family protein [Planktosalinus lacus]|uniref:Ion transporter n=1 Tax=Planktosalinus lacus TaxID=1526573 RepID=A0A8J2V9W3_9FLAO|nr:potassium channel family protein [Planktosalinus lacus]GGD91915.1 ion transporter [Planktosalinus lacus]